MMTLYMAELKKTYTRADQQDQVALNVGAGNERANRQCPRTVPLPTATVRTSELHARRQ
jgi:hypothetical protein